MIPTSTQVYDEIRVLLEDTEGGGGGRFTNPLLRPFLQAAWHEIHAAALSHNLPLIRRSVYPILPPYTGDLYPVVAGISNMGEIIEVAERSYLAANSIAISAIITPASALATVTTAATHPFVSGNRVTHHGVSGLSDDINDIWMIEKLTSTTYRIRGSTATGAHTASTGTATYSTEAFSTLKLVEKIDHTTAPGGSLSVYAWNLDRFIFPGANVNRQLRLTYQLSDALPDDESLGVGIDGCLPFLKFRTAGLALLNLAPQTAAQFNATALGGSLNGQDLNGFLGMLIRPQIRTSQRLPVVRPPFRPRRSTGLQAFGNW